MKNKVIVLHRTPVGALSDGDLALKVRDVGELLPGFIRVAVEYISVEPAMRGWVTNRTDYMPRLAPGDTLHAFGIGVVIQSEHAGFTVGQKVIGNLGAQEIADINPEMTELRTALPEPVPSSIQLGMAGITGLTAFFGMTKIARPSVGETFVVSAAAGAVGSVAGQLARLAGCKVIGIAGSDAKSLWLTRELGFDAVINRHSENVKARLDELCPEGIDIYFDNVGGDILDTCLSRLRKGARVVLCGGIATYNATEKPAGPANYFALVHRSALMQGFIVLDYLDEFEPAIEWIMTQYNAGLLINREEMFTGVESLPNALNALFEGSNTGKVLVKT